MPEVPAGHPESAAAGIRIPDLTGMPAPTPYAIVITDLATGRPSVSVLYTGEVILHEGVDVNEAARLFWTAVEGIFKANVERLCNGA